MQEDLIGYLLGALEPEEMRRVEAWLQESEEARQQLAELEAALAGLDEPEELPPPPADLVSRTLASLPPMPVAPDDSGDKQDSGEKLGQYDPVSQAIGAGNASIGNANIGNASAGVVGGVTAMSPAQESGGGSDWTWRDWLASITAACVVIAIALPSMLEGRFVARKQACQDNLRELGIAMNQFVTRNAEHRLPAVAPNGYQAFAGMYAPRLREAGLLGRDEQTLCPSLQRDQFWPTAEFASHAPVIDSKPVSESQPRRPRVVTLRLLDEVGQELMAMQPLASHDPTMNLQMTHAIEKLRWMQATAGGHYAYTLGVREGEHFTSPRFQGRSAFAVMSDAAILQRSGSYDDSGLPTLTLISHGGRGINVLYEDGRVGFLPSAAMDRMMDHPLLNHEGRMEAGVTIDDASLAPSWQPPFIRAIQR
ncbi:hypothetical protein [Neorhodopirellula lusitana]|uniref:hypothetical protein n=1 Tax=Neorhodopirellula lusitana TaxID=445327 RepID=UPI00384E10D0